jgi:tetratricopeptide (TPR) repeat protein
LKAAKPEEGISNNSVMPSIMKSFSMGKILPLAFLAVVSFMIYSGSIKGEFLFDDDAFIADNMYVKSLSNLPKVFSVDIGEGAGATSSYYRPLQMLTYMIEYNLFKLNTMPYHITNMFLHVFVVLSLFWMVKILVRDRTLAFITALLYSVHPVHVETVAYISGRADCIVALFIFLTFAIYLKTHEEKKPVWTLLLFACYIIALFAKENSLVLPGIILVYHYLFRKKIKWHILAAIIIISGAYLAFRISLIKAGTPGLSVEGVIQRVPGFFVAIFSYMKMLIWPFGLHMGHDFRLFSMMSWQALVGLILIIAGIYYAAINRNKDRLGAFAISWFFIAIFPVSNLFPLAFYMADHYLYVPSIGFFILVSRPLRNILQKKEMRQFAAAGITIIAVFFAILTTLQTGYWVSARKFYERTLKYNPQSARMWANLGKEYGLMGDNSQAITHFEKALSIEPENEVAYSNLAILYYNAGRKDDALASCKKAMDINPNNTKARNMLGVLQRSIGEYEEAKKQYHDAIQASPGNVTAMANLADLYSEKGELDSAKRILEKAIRINPQYAPSYLILGRLYLGRGQKEKAAELLARSVQLEPSAKAYNDLGVSYDHMGKHEEAVEALIMALQLEPYNKNAEKNISIVLQSIIAKSIRNKLYGRKGELDKAETLLGKSIQINPEYAFNYAMLGCMYNIEGKNEKAVHMLKRAIKLKPSSNAYSDLGVSYYNMGKLKEAMNAFSMALKLDPNHQNARQNLEVIRRQIAGNN